MKNIPLNVFISNHYMLYESDNNIKHLKSIPYQLSECVPPSLSKVYTVAYMPVYENMEKAILSRKNFPNISMRLCVFASAADGKLEGVSWIMLRQEHNCVLSRVISESS